MKACPISFQIQKNQSYPGALRKTGILLTIISAALLASSFFKKNASIFNATSHVIAASSIVGALGMTATIVSILKQKKMSPEYDEIRQNLTKTLHNFELQHAISEIKLSQLELIQKILQNEEEFQEICKIDKLRFPSQLIDKNNKFDLRRTTVNLPSPVQLACTQTFCNCFMAKLNNYLKDQLQMLVYPQPSPRKNFNCIIIKKNSHLYQIEYYLELKNVGKLLQDDLQVLLLEPPIPLKISFILTKNDSDEWILTSP